MRWYMPVIPALEEAETGGSRVGRQVQSDTLCQCCLPVSLGQTHEFLALQQSPDLSVISSPPFHTILCTPIMESSLGDSFTMANTHSDIIRLYILPASLPLTFPGASVHSLPVTSRHLSDSIPYDDCQMTQARPVW